MRAVGTTGSGRYLTGDFVGADIIKNEITAQATAAIFYHPEVDTIFEIGGQDSKYICIDHGVVVDFEMNKVCAAGTGSFLEEQAEKLGIDIVGRVRRAGPRVPAARRSSATAAPCSWRATSTRTSRRAPPRRTWSAGWPTPSCQNYLQKVVGAKRIGEQILFQGGVANNQAVVAAFEKVTGKTITVPPHFDVTGAIGAAMLARRQIRESGAPTAVQGLPGQPGAVRPEPLHLPAARTTARCTR